MIKKGENEKTFIISDKDEKKVSKSLKWKSFGFFAGGIATIILSVIVLFVTL